MKRILLIFSFVCMAVFNLNKTAYAQIQIKQSTTTTPLLFLMIDVTDHISGKTGLTPTVTIYKNGAAAVSPSGAVTELSNGWYKVAGNATDTNTLGSLALHASATGADPTDKENWLVVAYDPNDSVRIGITSLPNAAATSANGLLTSGVAANQLNTSSGNVALTAAAVQSIWDALTANLITANSIGSLLTTNITGNTFTRLGAPAGASVSADIAAVKTDTGNIVAKTNQFVFTNANRVDAALYNVNGTALSSKVGINWNQIFQNNGVNTTHVIDDIGGGTGVTDWTATERSQIRFRLGMDGTTNVPAATPSLGNVTVGTNNDKTGYTLSSTGINGVWDENAALHVTAGTLGKALNDTNTNAAAIKPKTDQLTFTVANQVNSNPFSVNSQALSAKAGINFNTFFQNGGNNTAQIVDNVGAGGGGTTDWTASERNQIRYRLGIDGSTAIPTAVNSNLYLNTFLKNTSGQFAPIEFYNSATGHFLTGLISASISCKISKDYAAFVATNDTAYAEIGNGLYKLVLTQAETNANFLNIACTATGARDYSISLFAQH